VRPPIDPLTAAGAISGAFLADCIESAVRFESMACRLSTLTGNDCRGPLRELRRWIYAEGARLPCGKGDLDLILSRAVTCGIRAAAFGDPKPMSTMHSVAAVLLNAERLEALGLFKSACALRSMALPEDPAR